MVTKLKDHTAWSMIEAMERASVRVDSWPEWKKTAFVTTKEQSTEYCAVETCSTSTEGPERTDE